MLRPVELKFWVPEFVVIYRHTAIAIFSILAVYLVAKSVAKESIINLMRRIE